MHSCMPTQRVCNHFVQLSHCIIMPPSVSLRLQTQRVPSADRGLRFVIGVAFGSGENAEKAVGEVLWKVTKGSEAGGGR